MQLQKANIHTALNNPLTAKDITGYAGLYKITYNGFVYSYIKNKFLLPGLGGAGYLTVSLLGKTQTIHTLVANHFIPNPENKKCVNHILGVKTFNHKDVLEWNTHGENNSHAITTGLKKPIHAAKGVIQMDMAGNEIARYHSSEHAPKHFSSGCICHVANGVRKQHGGYRWAWINN